MYFVNTHDSSTKVLRLAPKRPPHKPKGGTTMTSEEKKSMDDKLKEAIAEFEDPANHAALDARLAPRLLEAAIENEKILSRSREKGDEKIYR